MYFDVMDGAPLHSYENVREALFATGDHVHVIGRRGSSESLFLSVDEREGCVLWWESETSPEMASPRKPGVAGTVRVFDGQDATPVPAALVFSRGEMDELLSSIVETGKRPAGSSWVGQSFLFEPHGR